MADLVPLYERCIGHMTDYVAGELVAAIGRGLSTEDIAYALRETACAPRPSWRYARAILDRLERGGARDQRPQRQDGGQQYHQREYDAQFFDSFFVDLSGAVVDPKS